MASRLQDVLLVGIRADQPLATDVANGTLYSVSDEDFLIEQSDGAAWSQYGASPTISSAITSLTGDVTGTGPGATATTIAAGVVSNAKFRDSAGVSVVGRAANTTGSVADITASSNDTFLQRVSNALSFAGLTIGMIANNLITYAKLQQVSASKLLGNPTVGTADVSEIGVTSGLEFNSTNLRVTAAARTQTIGITVDGGGTVLTTGNKGLKSFMVAGTITRWRLMSDVAGNIEFDIQKSTYAGFPPTSSIVAAAPPLLSGVRVNENSSLGTWTTSVAAGDVFEFVIGGTPATITRVTLELTLEVTG